MFQVLLGIFHGIEAIFVIAFHTKSETDLRSQSLMTIEYHKNFESLDIISETRKGSDVSISINIEDEDDPSF